MVLGEAPVGAISGVYEGLVCIVLKSKEFGKPAVRGRPWSRLNPAHPKKSRKPSLFLLIRGELVYNWVVPQDFRTVSGGRRQRAVVTPRSLTLRRAVCSSCAGSTHVR